MCYKHREAFFDVKVPPELKHTLLVHDCVTSAIKLVTPLAVHGLMGATICSIEIGVELAEQPTKAPLGPYLLTRLSFRQI